MYKKNIYYKFKYSTVFHTYSYKCGITKPSNFYSVLHLGIGFYSSSSSSSEDENNNSDSSVGSVNEERTNRNIISQVTIPGYSVMDRPAVNMGFFPTPRYLPFRRPRDDNSRLYNVMANPMANFMAERAPAASTSAITNLSNGGVDNTSTDNNNPINSDVSNVNNTATNSNANNASTNSSVNNNNINTSAGNNTSNVNTSSTNITNGTDSTSNNISNNRSLIDDYADPNLEQPSYMDPED